MTYKLGRKVRPKYQRVKLASLSVLAVLCAGTVATAYANSQNGQSLLSPFHMVKRTLSNASATVSHKHIAASGSSHEPAKTAGSVTATKTSLTSQAGLRTASCTLFPPKNADLSSATAPELRKLAQYEQLCNGDLVGRDSFFAPTPDSLTAAQSDAADMADRLKDYAQHGVTPLVFLEPDTDSGTNLDLSTYANGAYDSVLDAYFSDLKTDGITDSTMGMWVLLPEGNLPEWTSVNPQIYDSVVTRTAQLQKKYFPSSQDSLMLDSETYPSASSWSNGAYVSLLPYVQGIPKGLIDSFGLQGFPWSPPANQAGPALNNPQVYLRADFAAQAATALGIKSIWFNTGTFHQMYTNSAVETVTNTPLQRQAELNGVVAEAKQLQSQGYTVAVHLFAQNKADTSEAIDWSYWQTQPSDEADTAVFTTFVHDLTVSNIPLWLFDTYDQ